MGLSLSDNISYSYTNSWLWDRFRLLTSFGDLGHRKVEHHTEQNIGELSAPRWRIRETGYTRCILDGTPLLTPPVDSTRTRNADSFDESGVPVYSLTADKTVSTDPPSPRGAPERWRNRQYGWKIEYTVIPVHETEFRFDQNV